MFADEDILRFLGRIDMSATDGGCWEWRGTRGTQGYGVFHVNGKPRRAHRVSYLLSYGEWPEPCCLHRCDNPGCVRPSHLFAGTLRDNVADMVAKDRQSRGDSYAMAMVRRYGPVHHNAKLNDRIVKDMRARHANGERIAVLAREAGVTWRTAKQAICGETWRHGSPTGGTTSSKSSSSDSSGRS